MSPLGEAIYHVLAQRVGLENPLISYYELHKKLPPLDPPYDNITWNDERLFQALRRGGPSLPGPWPPYLDGTSHPQHGAVSGVWLLPYVPPGDRR